MQWHSLPALGRVLWSCNTWEGKQLCQALNHRRHKPPQCITSCRLDFDTSLSSIATLAQLPLPSYPHSPHSRLPSTDPPYFTLASLHFLSFPFCTPHLSLLPTPPSFPLSPHSYNMLVPLLYRSVLHYIQLYGLCYLRQHTAVTHDENNALSPPAPHLSVSWLELLYDSFSPSSNHKPSKDMIAMATHFFRYRFKVWSCLCLFWSCLRV